MKIAVFRPTIRRRDMDNVLTCMISDRLEAGALSGELAARIAGYIGLAGGLACSNYYTSLRLALNAAALSCGDRVIVSALSPSFYLGLLKERGLIPLIADIDPDSCVISVKYIKEKLLSQGPRAILLHYTLGFIPDLDALFDLGIPVIEDISQGLGGNYGSEQCGSYGDFTIVSLDPEGIITAGMGGLVLASDKNKLKNLKSLNIRTDHLLSDFNASLGLAQAKEIESFLATRAEIAQIFSESVRRSHHKILIQRGDCNNIYYSFPVLLNSGLKEVGQYARKQNIRTEQAFKNVILTVPEIDQDGACPNASNIIPRCILFPLYPMLGKTRIETISKVLSTLP